MALHLKAADWWKIGILSAVFIGGVLASYQILKPEPRLPIYNPSDLNERLVDENLRSKGKDHRVLPFALYNQYGDTIHLDDVEDKIYVADFFFTTCPGICKDMAQQKRRLQKELKDDSLFALVSHTVTPGIDSVPVMQDYAERQGAIRGKWQLLTGPKEEIYRLARKSYFAVLDSAESGKDGSPEDFIHTENFVLVDPDQRIRGYYDGTSAEDIDRLLEDYAILRQEYRPE